MKLAIFHNYMDNIGGAEIVALTLARELKADVFTTNFDPEKIRKMGFGDILSRIFSIGKISLNPPFRQQLALWKFRRLNLKDKYDFFIIAGDWAMSAAVKNKPNLWYAHSPLNELWAFKDYIKNTLKVWQRPLFEIWVQLNRQLTKKYSRHVQVWISNSQNTRSRIKKYYGKDAAVIPPPIETNRFFYNKNSDSWLSVSRLSKAKRIDIQLKAFAELPNEKLIIVGSYEKGARHFEKEKIYLDSIMKKNVQIKSWVSQEELARLYASCKGFITTSIDEDFGMSVVEAMASGKPVIAPNEGGYKESVLHGKTGILINNITSEKLAAEIKKLNEKINQNPESFKRACQEQAKKFDTKIFIGKIKKSLLKQVL